MPRDFISGVEVVGCAHYFCNLLVHTVSAGSVKVVQFIDALLLTYLLRRHKNILDNK